MKNRIVNVPTAQRLRIPRGTRSHRRADFAIDKEIAAQIPSLSPEDLAQIERSILAERCREPLTVLLIRGKKILGDGHKSCIASIGYV
jgi:hypothetical protein